MPKPQSAAPARGTAPPAPLASIRMPTIGTAKQIAAAFTGRSFVRGISLSHRRRFGNVVPRTVVSAAPLMQDSLFRVGEETTLAGCKRGKAAVAALAISVMLTGGAQAAALKVTSTAFQDGGLLTVKYIGHLVLKSGNTEQTDCGGENVSPPLAWTNVPAGTKSFGLVIFDPDGAKGSGAVHWVMYGVSGDRRGIPEGFGNKESPDYVGGTSSSGNHTYMGPCAMPEHTNHYLFSVYALDLDPKALPPGLTRDQFFAQTKGHVLDVGSIVGRGPSHHRSGP